MLRFILELMFLWGVEVSFWCGDFFSSCGFSLELRFFFDVEISLWS